MQRKMSLARRICGAESRKRDSDLWDKSPLTILDELGAGTGRLQDFTESDCGSFISGVSAKWDMLAKSLTESLETAEGRIEDYRFYSLELLYLLMAGHLKPVKKAYVTGGQRRIADEAEKCICRILKKAS